MNERSDVWDEWIRKSRVLLSGYQELLEAELHTQESPAQPDAPPTLVGRHEYLDEKEQGEWVAECRTALASVLMTGKPPMEICRLLAEQIAPDGSVAAGERKISFGFRSRNRRPQSFRDTSIARLISHTVESGNSVEQAIAIVAGKVNMSESNVKRIWDNYKPFRDAKLI